MFNSKSFNSYFCAPENCSAWTLGWLSTSPSPSLSLFQITITFRSNRKYQVPISLLFQEDRFFRNNRQKEVFKMMNQQETSLWSQGINSKRGLAEPFVRDVSVLVPFLSLHSQMVLYWSSVLQAMVITKWSPCAFDRLQYIPCMQRRSNYLSCLDAWCIVQLG